MSNLNESESDRKWPPYPNEYPSRHVEENPDRIIPNRFRDLNATLLLGTANVLHQELEELLQHPERLKALESPNNGMPVQRELDVSIMLIEVRQDVRRVLCVLNDIRKNGWPLKQPYRRI